MGEEPWGPAPATVGIRPNPRPPQPSPACYSYPPRKKPQEVIFPVAGIFVSFASGGVPVFPIPSSNNESTPLGDDSNGKIYGNSANNLKDMPSRLPDYVREPDSGLVRKLIAVSKTYQHGKPLILLAFTAPRAA